MLRRGILSLGVATLILSLAILYWGGVAGIANHLTRWLRVAPSFRLSPETTEGGWNLYAETAHFRYYVRPGDRIPQWTLQLAEDHLEATCATLGLSFAGSIDYYKHASHQDRLNVTGVANTGVAFAEIGSATCELHSVSAYDPHEVVHAVVHTALGKSPASFDEGVATALSWQWMPKARDVHAQASQLLQEGRLIGLSRILTNWDFRSYKSYPAYTMAGSFAAYLLEQYGSEKYRELLTLDRLAAREEIEACFKGAYGESIYAVEAVWREALASGGLGTTDIPVSGSRSSLLVTAMFLFVGVFAAAIVLIVAGERVAAKATRWGRTLWRAVSGR